MNVSVPMEVEGNRPYVHLTLQGKSGSIVSARFLMDSGGGGFVLTEPLARRLGLTWGGTMREQGEELAVPDEPPRASIEDFALKLDAKRVIVVVGKDNVLPPAAPGGAEGILPGHILARYHVVFDYLRGMFTLAEPGAASPRGERSPMPVSKRSGFPWTELTIDGEAHGFLLDTGASFTIVSDALLKSLGAAHPGWPRYKGAFEDAAMLGGQTLETLVVPAASWAGFELTDFGVVSQREGTFEQWMSSMMSSPIVGSLAGNALSQFRLELDYANDALYLTR